MRGASFFSRNKSQDILNVTFTGTSFDFSHFFADSASINKRLLVGISGNPTSFSGVTRSAGGTGSTRPYSITGLSAGPKIAQIKTFNTGEIGYSVFGAGLTGELDVSKWNKIESNFYVQQSPGLTAVTNPSSWCGLTSSNYIISGTYYAANTGIKNLDISMFKRLEDLEVFNNPSLTGITFPTNFLGPILPRNIQIYSNNLQGHLDLTPFGVMQSSYSFRFYLNPGLTGITFNNVPPKVGAVTSPLIYGYNCNLQGNLDLTPLSGFPILIGMANNNITGITFPSEVALNSGTNRVITNGIRIFDFSYNDLQGTLDLTRFPNFGGSVNDGSLELHYNSGLTEVLLTASSKNFNTITLNNCNLTGNLNLSGLTGRLGGFFSVANNPNLTGITFSSGCTFSTATTVTEGFYVNNCNITGVLNLSGITGLGSGFLASNNLNLTQIIHGPSTNGFSVYQVANCKLTGTHDLTPLSGLSGSLQLYSNSGLTNISFPVTTGTFTNNTASESDSAFALFSCNLDYVDFKPLSGATLNNSSRIRLQNNGMSAGDVNHILVDFSGNATYNTTGWDNISLNIGGTNANPDSVSGGYDGLAAISFLTGSPYNWTITY